MSFHRSNAPPPSSVRDGSPPASSPTNPFPESFYERLLSPPPGSPTNPFSDSFFERLFSAGDVVELGPVSRGPLPNPPAPITAISRNLSKLSIDQVPGNSTRVVVSPRGAEPRVEDIDENSLVPFRLEHAPGQLYALAQSHETPFFSLVFRCRQCVFYFDPGSNSLVLRNATRGVIEVATIKDNQNDEEAGDPQRTSLDHRNTCQLAPGPWRIFSRADGGDSEIVADLFVFHRRYTVMKGTAGSQDAGSKRRRLPAEDGESSKRPRGVSPNADQTVVLIGTHSEGSMGAETQLQLVKTGNPILDLQPGQKIGIETPPHTKVQGCEDLIKRGDRQHSADNYTLVHRRDIAVAKNLASVFSARHNIYGEIAVKVIRSKAEPGYLSVPRLAREWKNEQGFLRKIKHPSIIGFLGSDARLYSIYMEYLPFSDLAASPWRRGPGNFFTGTEEDAVRIIRDMASALAHIHDQSILHNDIKPSNILFDRGRGPVLIDFGLATPSNSGTACSGGSPWYVPPEYPRRLQREAPSDVFALGVTGLYLLQKIALPDITYRGWVISEVPKSASAEQAMIHWLEIVAAKSAALGTTGVEGLVARMLKPDPDYRIAASDIVKAGVPR